MITKLDRKNVMISDDTYNMVFNSVDVTFGSILISDSYGKFYNDTYYLAGYLKRKDEWFGMFVKKMYPGKPLSDINICDILWDSDMCVDPTSILILSTNSNVKPIKQKLKHDNSKRGNEHKILSIGLSCNLTNIQICTLVSRCAYDLDKNGYTSRTNNNGILIYWDYVFIIDCTLKTYFICNKDNVSHYLNNKSTRHEVSLEDFSKDVEKFIL